MPKFTQALEFKQETLRRLTLAPAYCNEVIADLLFNNHDTHHLELADLARECHVKTLSSRDSTYFWSEDITNLIKLSAESLPLTFTFSLTKLPSPLGFIWLEKSINLGAFYLRAISWNTWDDNVGILMHLWITTEPDGFAIPGFAHPFVPNLSLQSIFELSSTDQGWKSFPEFIKGIKIFCSMLVFLEQQLFTAVTAYSDRATHRRLVHQHGPVERAVQVITLRRPHRQSYNEDEDRTHVEWSCRWLVRGHWRNQYHPSTRSHKITWIHPYQKGPDDKPLALREKVFEVVR